MRGSERGLRGWPAYLGAGIWDRSPECDSGPNEANAASPDVGHVTNCQIVRSLTAGLGRPVSSSEDRRGSLSIGITKSSARHQVIWGGWLAPSAGGKRPGRGSSNYSGIGSIATQAVETRWTFSSGMRTAFSSSDLPVSSGGPPSNTHCLVLLQVGQSKAARMTARDRQGACGTRWFVVLARHSSGASWATGQRA